MAQAPRIFDRPLLRRRRERAAATLPGADFLVAEVSERLAERLEEIRRDFPATLVLGGHRGRLVQAVGGQTRAATLVVADASRAMLEDCGALRVVADEEMLPFGPDRFDLVVSAQVLHWVNDLPGTLAQLRYCLKPDGLLLAAFPGGGTLAELRAALLDAELEMEGGGSPRVSPFVDVRDAGALLQRAGFALPMVDVDRIHVSYPDPLALLRDLRAMGETNALVERRHHLRRDTLARALGLYAERHADAAGRVSASYEILFLTAWKPHPSQPRALRPGSAAGSLAEVLARPPGGDRPRGDVG